MSIKDGQKVSINYKLSLENDQVIDTNEGKDPLTYVQGQKQIIPGLEKEISKMKAGENKKITVQPEEAYGNINPQAIVEVEKARLPEESLKVGAGIQSQNPNGQTMNGVITEVGEEKATIDFNHPLAGKTLHFEIELLEIQE